MERGRTELQKLLKKCCEEREIGRQIIHMTVGLSFLIPLHLFGIVGFEIFMGILSVLGLTAAYALKCGKRVPIASELVDKFERPEELEKLPGQGTIYFVIGVMIAGVITFDVKCMDIVITVLSVGDSVSTIVGTRFGTTRIPYSPRKTLEGSLSGFVAASIASALVTGDLAASTFCSAVGMMVESLPTPNDNLTIPIAVALASGWWYGIL